MKTIFLIIMIICYTILIYNIGFNTSELLHLKETIMKDINKIVREYKIPNRDFDVEYWDLFKEASESYQTLKFSSKEIADDFVRQMIEIRYNEMK